MMSDNVTLLNMSRKLGLGKSSSPTQGTDDELFWVTEAIILPCRMPSYQTEGNNYV